MNSSSSCFLRCTSPVYFCDSSLHQFSHFSVITYTEEYTSPILLARAYQAVVLDADKLIPKLMPQAFQSIELIQGDGGIGSIKKINFAPGTPFTSLKHRIDEIDEKAYKYSYTMIEGNYTRVRIESTEISAKSDLSWNKSFSLQCLGADQESSLNALAQSCIIFELRWRSDVSLIQKIVGSQLLGRAEVSWKDVFESSEMVIEKWVIMAKKSSRRVHDDSKPSAVKVSRFKFRRRSWWCQSGRDGRGRWHSGMSVVAWMVGVVLVLITIYLH